MECHAVQQRRRGPLIRFDALVQGDDGEPGRQDTRQPVSLQRNRPVIERRAQPRRDPGLDPLCHGEHDHTAIGLRQQPLLYNWPSRLERRRQVEAAKQPVISGMSRQAMHPHSRWQRITQQRQKMIADRARCGADGDTGKAKRIIREQCERPNRIGPGCRAAHVPNSSATARVTRVLATASSNGLRRSRCPDHRCDPAQVRFANGAIAIEAGNSTCGADKRQFPSEAIGTQRHAQSSRLFQRAIRDFDRSREIGHRRCGAGAYPAASSRFPQMPLDRARSVAPADDVYSCRKVVGRAHVN